MAISNAVQSSGFVHIYNESGHITATIGVGSEPDDGLKGYTSSSVNIKMGSFVHSYDEQGHVINTVAG